MTNTHTHTHTYHLFFIHSSVDGHLVASSLDYCKWCCHAMNIGVHISFQIMIWSGYRPRSGISGSYGNSIFSFLRNLHTVFHNSCTNLHSHQQRRWDNVGRLFDDGYSDQCVVVIVVLICISLIISDDKHLFICL